MSGAASTPATASRSGTSASNAISPASNARLPLYKRLFKSSKAPAPESTTDTGVRQAVANMPPRRIFVNRAVPADDLAHHADNFCTNAITTSQYTLLNFLPKNLSRQFRRVANIYFLALTVLQLINYFAVGNRFLTVVPIILVLSITAIKDAYEDTQRHISDRLFNETHTRIVRNLRNVNLLWQDQQTEAAKSKRLLDFRIRLARRMKRKTWYNQIPHDWEESRNPVDTSNPPVLDEDAKWRNVRIGDFVILKTGDPAPADILILSTSADDGGCYVETKNLDGETNLKPRASLIETAGLRDAEGCGRLQAVVDIDPPSSNMTRLNGSITIYSTPATGPSSATPPRLASERQISPTSPFNPSSISPTSATSPRSNGNTIILSADSYEMRVLGQKQNTVPFRQSPLATATARPPLASHFGSDDEPSMSMPFDPLATAATNSTSDVLDKSLPNNVDYGTNPVVAPFSITNVLLRGMTVRNTDWAIGLVMYTGDQTKIVLNSGPTPYKRSRIERMMNIQVMMSFGFVFATSFIVALVGGLKYAKPEHRFSPYVDTSMAKGTYGFALFWSAMIMLQNVIPIALYVSIEFVKSWHAYWIYQDMYMYYEPTDQRCMARNWNISDDLGQVSYIFSDKTGTLTRNVMDFRMCSINGTIYGKQLPGDELDVVKGRMAQEEVDRNNPPEGGTNPFFMEIQDEVEDDDIEGLNRPSTNGSTGTNQYDHSPLISTADAPADRFNATPQHSIAPATSVPIGAVRSRGRTMQVLSEEEAQAKRKLMIGSYLSAMRKVFDPKYVEIGNEETGEGGAYTFVDPQIFYDMKPEVAPAHRVAATPGSDNLAVNPHVVRRVGSHRSIGHGFDVNPARQRDMVDLFLTELATCHSVVVEKSFQKHIANDDTDDRSTLRRLTRIFHRRNSSKRASDMARHARTRSHHHARTTSVMTASSAGEGVEWVSSEGGASAPRMGHAHSASSASVAFQRSGDTSAGTGDERFSLTSPVRGSMLRLGDDVGPLSPDVLSSPLEQDFDHGTHSPQDSASPQDMSRLAYSAESPDEGALVRAAKNLGYTFLGRVKGTVYLDVRGERMQYEVLDTVEFSSSRKRMTTILRRPAPYNDIMLFCKGADNVMTERLARLPSKNEMPSPYASHDEVNFERLMRERTFNQIDEFANAGLRTLMLCYRRLTESEWVRWSARYHAALGSVAEDRDEQVASIADEMERDLRMVGATAIEDKLQEKVPDTIASLRAAGIKIWVLTGDKMETAINIGFAANLLTKEMELWTITSSSGSAKILSRFHLIARIMRQLAASEAAASKAEAPSATHAQANSASVGLGPDDARALGSVSYKINRAKKFLNISQTLRAKHKQRANVNSTVYPMPTSTPASGAREQQPQAMSSPASAFPQLRDDDMSPAEVQQSIEYLRRHSSLTEDGQQYAQGGSSAEAYQPLNALVIDGAALSVVMGDPECRALMLEIAPLFKSVICCRASPLQKAEVVKLIKDGLDLVTLAIGDGANDVSMIQTADIGVAISGEEGLQAAMASDYTVGRFHFLQNLLLVHGLFDYLRMSEMILSFFYKNVIWAMVPFWYSIYCAFSANVFYDLSYIQLYNVVFTVAPVVILGCVDKPFNYKTAMTYVAVYSDGIHNRYFRWWRYYLYVIDGIYQSMVIFFTFYIFTYQSDMQNENGRTWGRSDISTGPTVAVVIAASLCVGFNAWQWNWLMIVAIILSIVVCIAYISISSAVRYYSLEGVATSVMSTIVFWFGVPISVVVALLPRYCVRCWQKMNMPRDLDIIREIKVLHRPWYGQVFVDPDSPLEFLDKDDKHAKLK
ncbi:hypothetical protein IWW39_002956 [Coemansia spiralis]|uniref:P-type phospholipid transporter n=2 Tax=Coemansia TaxID=4863 RepID=A0A9W8GJ93_9FUNG|nr:hypothetical protein IWW39_002956 [Coemansia spiralis]